MKTIIVVGGGFGGLAAAALLAKQGFAVELFEKNDQCGGRARSWTSEGFAFDMGPSWYLMPEVFERFFGLFGSAPSDHYELVRLKTSYRAFFGPGDFVDVESSPDEVGRLFESLEPGGARKLSAYLANAREKYRIAMDHFLYQAHRHVGQLLSPPTLVRGARLGVLGNLDSHVSGYFKSRRARQLLEYTSVFLGTDPRRTPALYSLLSHVDLEQGVYFPTGGMSGVAQAVEALARAQGAKIHTRAEVESLIVEDGRAKGAMVNGQRVSADGVLVNADYAWAETHLLPQPAVSISERAWKRKTIAPGAFVMYVGTRPTGDRLSHHNLYFQPDWTTHFDAVFKKPDWPREPNFYLAAISKTDPSSAPSGLENLFVLVPVAAGLDDHDRDAYGEHVLEHVERVTGTAIVSGRRVQRIFSQRDFENDYHAYRGTALGLSHTLAQSALFRPPLRSRKVSNLYYAGQYTHPGIGVPMVLIAAENAARAMEEDLS